MIVEKSCLAIYYQYNCLDIIPGELNRSLRIIVPLSTLMSIIQETNEFVHHVTFALVLVRKHHVSIYDRINELIQSGSCLLEALVQPLQVHPPEPTR